MTFNDRDILTHAGKIEKFHTNRLSGSAKSLSDFDKVVKQIETTNKKGKRDG
ncbi:hypothetical protein INT08_05990 [Prosthecochloris sp. N3]|uniref:Uncharacterized protein n=1 Tax=Prosthecochloris ethylica TaxID=2743976 RepID=A0ABR9XS70_9CHLB|nr:hypothetical protein [Prosthecochloris ethylica]MBF0586821.1 hypothetical protein [Prosthecochloris ethylica]MBF0636727.1 hypothetical protein [Prosthecochloris ethylica]MEC9486572.1 hypothetical protein [Prosthecochloris sp.]NUK48543.1 hypothetical protein [Prosthecochloris ethylica]